MALLPFSPPPSPWIKYSDTTRYNIGGSNTGGVGINTNTEAQVSRLDIRLSSTDSLPSMAFKNAGNTMSAGESEYMYARLGENGNYAGYLKFWPSSGSENNWSFAIHTTPYPGASSRYLISSPSFNSPVNGRGDVSIMTWTNDGSNNFSGYMDIGEPYWFGAAPATYASVNVGIGKTSTSFFSVKQYTNYTDLLTVNGLSGNVGIGTATTGTSNRLLVNAYNTIDNSATAQINSIDASNKGLVVQGYTSQSANLQEWQGSDGFVWGAVGSGATGGVIKLYGKSSASATGNSGMLFYSYGATYSGEFQLDYAGNMVFRNSANSSAGMYMDYAVGGGLNFRAGGGTTTLGINSNGAATFKNTTNSTAAFSVLNASGTGMLSIDTTNTAMNFAEALNVGIGTTTGTKIGTGTNQKIGFWNATPIVQPTTSVGASTLTGGGGTTITDTDTFDGYTLKQVVKALRNIGILA